MVDGGGAREAAGDADADPGECRIVRCGGACSLVRVENGNGADRGDGVGDNSEGVSDRDSGGLEPGGWGGVRGKACRLKSRD